MQNSEWISWMETNHFGSVTACLEMIIVCLQEIASLDPKEIASGVLHFLPELESLTAEQLEQIYNGKSLLLLMANMRHYWSVEKVRVSCIGWA